MLNAKILTSGLRRLRRNLGRGGVPADIQREALDAAAELMLARVVSRFSTKTDAEGNPWPPSKYSSDLLVKTGNLRDSIEMVRNNQFSRSIIQDEGKAPYGVFHEEGIGVAQRSFMGVSSEDESALSNAYESRLTSRLSERFR